MTRVIEIFLSNSKNKTLENIEKYSDYSINDFISGLIDEYLDTYLFGMINEHKIEFKEI